MGVRKPRGEDQCVVLGPGGSRPPARSALDSAPPEGFLGVQKWLEHGRSQGGSGGASN
jgi:hypothetical protein